MNRRPDNPPNPLPPVIDDRGLSLRRKIQAGFLLAVLLTLLTGGGLVALLKGAIPNLTIDTATETPNIGLEGLATRMHYALAGSVLGALAALTALYRFMMRCIVLPLEATAAAAHQLVNGRLGATVPIQGPPEINAIGKMLNDMGVNLQELVLLVWNQTGSALRTIEGLSAELGPQHLAKTGAALRDDLKSVRQNLDTLQTVAQSFDLYDVRLTGRKAVALEDHPGSPHRRSAQRARGLKAGCKHHAPSEG